MLKTFVKGLLGRLLSYSVFGLGFWFLFQGFLQPNIALAALGGSMVLAGMYLMVTARRIISATPVVDSTNQKEDSPSDLVNGGDKSDKLPP